MISGHTKLYVRKSGRGQKPNESESVRSWEENAKVNKKTGEYSRTESVREGERNRENKCERERGGEKE